MYGKGEIMAKNRNIALCIVFSIITCGIYALYWLVVLTDEVNEIAGDAEGTTGGMVLLFTIITCGIYGYYWAYKTGEKVDMIRRGRGEISSNTGILYLILNIIGLSVVTYALIQNEINKSVPAY